jgi:hypothetical protein
MVWNFKEDKLIRKRDLKLLKGFKKRWEKVRAFEANELRSLSIEQKFYQLVSIIRIGLDLKIDCNEDVEKLKVRTRWVRLKKGI